MQRFHYWRIQIQGAGDEHALARILREYRSMISPAMIKSLPGQCRESLDSADIPNAARTLLQAAMTYEGAPEVVALLHEVARTYAAAAVRIAGLGA